MIEVSRKVGLSRELERISIMHCSCEDDVLGKFPSEVALPVGKIGF